MITISNDPKCARGVETKSRRQLTQNCLSSQCQCLEDVRSGPYGGIKQHREFPGRLGLLDLCGFHNMLQRPQSRHSPVDLSTAMVRDDDTIYTRVDRELGIGSALDPLQ